MKSQMMPSPRQWFQKLSKTRSFFLLAGPCVIEDLKGSLQIARHLKRCCDELEIPYVFKGSFDKANRTSSASFRGPGVEEGLEILLQLREKVGCPVMTDVHTEAQALTLGQELDILQIPAFLCRQTDLILAAASTPAMVNVKKGQFMSPSDMEHVVQKIRTGGNQKILLTERGTTFGYNNLVVDMRSIPIMKGFKVPVVFDATHSVQLPGGAGDRSSGQSEFVPTLAKASLAAGANGLFIETHPRPDQSPSDGPNMIPLKDIKKLLQSCQRIRQA